LPFLDAYLEHTKIYESPSSFWLWSGYSTIAATLRDSVWLSQGDGKLFPNIYVLLLAGSGQRKGKPVDLANKLMNDLAHIKVIAGRSSIQAILIELSRTESAKDGKIIKGGSAIFYAPELTAAIVADPAAVGVLTDIYEYKEKYDRNLSSGKINLERIVFNMFTASNEALLKEVFDNRAMEGGLLARTFLVTPDEWRPSNSLFGEYNLADSYTNLMRQLVKIAGLSGKFSLTKIAKERYDEWYIPFRNSLEKRADKSGVLSRIHTSILKLMMVVAANELTLEINETHVEKAIDDSIKLLPNYQAFSMGGGKSTIAECGNLVLSTLATSKDHRVSRKELLQRHWASYDSIVLDSFITHAEQGGILRSEMAGSVVHYSLTKEGKEILGIK
jgi:hypothetical protein